MTVDELLIVMTRLSFVGLGILSILDFARHRGEVRRDIALMFNSIGGAIAAGVVNSLLETPSTLISTASALAILAQPYLLIRLVRYFRPLSRTIQRGSLAGMLLSWAIVLLAGTPVPVGPTIVVLIYFVVSDVYAMAAFVQGALITSGVVQQRLRFTAAGAGLLALSLLSVGVGAVIPALMPVTSLLVQLGAIASAITFYLGLAPPIRLRRTWQFGELRQFLVTLNRETQPTSAQQLYAILCQGVAVVTGATHACILLRTQEERGWLLINPNTADWPKALEPIPELEFAWQSRTPAVFKVQTLSETSRAMLRAAGTAQLYAVPFARDRKAWGLVLAYLDHGSLFIEDDIQIIQLLTEQGAVVLENIELVESLREQTANLEKKTAHLTDANQELEAFSYSVSHDLRTPLRAVDGFSLALYEDYGEALDDIGKDFLFRIRSESQRMGQLIDDLIGFSRFARAEMKITDVNLSAMARDIVADLAANDPERQVDVVIQDGVTACGDAQLIRVALENLLENAWKYTSKKPSARIEFATANRNGVREYYVKDNGAGFDMTYAHKLFGAFQRLHAMDEFTGTGIGLAIVKRIIHRHSGTVRAEGIVNEGAVFTFTLGMGTCA